MAELAYTLIQSVSLNDISALVFAYATRLTESKFGFIAYIEAQTGKIIYPTLVEGLSKSGQLQKEYPVINQFQCVWEGMIEHRTSFWTNTMEDIRFSKAIPGGVLIQRILAVPAKIDDKLMGIVALANSTRDYSERDLELVERLAAMYALAIQRKQSEDAIKKYTKELEESNYLKDLFTDIISHDLMNPAGVVHTSTEILLQQEKDPMKLKMLELIQNSSTKLIGRISSAANYSKLKNMEIIERELQDLNSMLKGVLCDLQYQLEEKQIQVNYQLEEKEYLAQVNEIIEDVFLNLISNAIKYSPTGSLIELSIQDQDDKWTVVVKDFGDGIRDTDREKLFTRFERLDKEGVKGTGLGLVIAKRIVELHCGSIWVEDNAEGGSIFKVDMFKDGPRRDGDFLMVEDNK